MDMVHGGTENSLAQSHLVEAAYGLNSIVYVVCDIFDSRECTYVLQTYLLKVCLSLLVFVHLCYDRLSYCNVFVCCPKLSTHMPFN